MRLWNTNPNFWYQHRRFIDADICSICCYQFSKIGLADVTFITEQTNTPELISFVQRSVDMEDVDVQFELVQFMLQIIPKMLRLMSRIAKYDCTLHAMIL